MMNKYNGNFKEFKESWKKVTSKTPVGNIQQLSLAVRQFFKGISTRYETQWHPLFIAAEQGSLRLCEHIINKTGDITSNLDSGSTPLHLAVQGGHLETYQFLAKRLKDKNPGSKIGWTPLHQAAQEGYVEIAR